MEDQSEPVQVFVRIRPEFDEIGEKSTPLKTNASFRVIGSPLTQTENSCVSAVDDHTLRITPPDDIYGTRKTVPSVDDKVYHFDRIFQEPSSQEEIYDAVAEHVLATVKGYNTTIFAYGVTGSGKSYTMTGNKQAPGIIPRAIADIFKHIEKAASETDVYFYVRLSYVELYNNNFRNLLENIPKENFSSLNRTANSSISMSGFFSELDEHEVSTLETHYGPTFAYARMTSSSGFKEHSGFAQRSDKIEVRESKSAGTFLHGPNLRFPVTSAVEAFQLISKGNKMRAVASTNCNEESSRSHAIITFHVESKLTTSAGADGIPKTEMRIGKIHLVDLAGSERLAISGAEGDTLIETKNINSSLTALGDVLSALSKNATIITQRQKQLKEGLKVGNDFHQPPTLSQVPYRNSKLTHLLKDSLGGNSKTIMITNIRKTKEYYQLTNISLMYASRAKKVRNKSTINRNVLGDSAIHTVSSELERFKKVLEEKTNEFERLKLHVMNSESEKSALKGHLREMKNAIETEKRLYEEKVSHLIHSHAGQIASQKEKIGQLQSALQDELTLSQNRIAEQEQEIKWLKKALDESNQVANQDEIEKAKKIAEFWQNQAKAANHELNVVLNQAEELKALYTSVQAQVRELEHERKVLDEEVSQRSNECNELSNHLFQAAKEKEELTNTLTASKKAYEEARAILKEQLQANSDREKSVKDNQKLIESLENELKAARDANNSQRSKVSQLNQRLHELEAEKAELTSKLSSSIHVLEKKSQETIEDLNNQLHQKKKTFEELDSRIHHLQDELDKQRHAYSELKEISNIKLAQKDKSIEELEAALQRELQISSKQASKLLIAEGDVEGLKDKIARMQNKMKERTDGFEKILQERNEKIQHLEHQLQLSKESLDQDRQKMITEFEKILEEKHLSQAQEIQQLKEQSEQKRSLLERDLTNRIQQLEAALKEKDTAYVQAIKEKEHQVRAMIDQEIASLTKKHEEETAILRKEHEEALDGHLKQVRRSLSTDHEQSLFSLEQQLKNVYDSKLKDSLQIQQRALRQEAQEQKEKIISDLELKHQSEIKQFEKILLELKASHKQSLANAQQMQQQEQDHEIAKLRASLEYELKQRLLSLQSDHEAQVAQLKEQQHQLLLDTLKKEKEQLSRQLQQQAEKQTLSAVELAVAELRKTLGLEHNANQQKLKSDLEARHQALLNEKEEEITQLNNKITQLLITHQDELRKSLTSQEQTLLESSNAEIEMLRSELVEKKKLFQSELNELRKAHNEDMSQQRADLEKNHQKVVAALEEDLRATKDKIAFLEEEINNLHRESSVSLEELKHKLEQQHHEDISALQRQHEEELEHLNSQHALDLQQRKNKFEKVKESHLQEIEKLLEDHRNDLARVKASMTEKHSKEIEDLKSQFNVELKNVRDITTMTKDDQIQELQETMKILAMKKEEEVNRLQNEIAALQLKGANEVKEKAERIQELEDRLELLQSGKEGLNKKYQEEVNRLEEKLARSEQGWKARYEEEVTRLEGRHDEFLNALKTQHRNEVERLKDERDQELARHALESKQFLEKKDSFYQKELENLRQLLNENAQMRMEKVDQLQEEIISNRQVIHQLQNDLQQKEINHVSERKRAEKEFNQKLDLLKESYETALSDLQKEKVEQLLEKEAAWNEAKQDLILSYEQKLLEKENYYNKDLIPSILKKSEKEKQLLLQEKNQIVESLTSQQQQELTSLQTVRQEIIDHYEKEIRELKREHSLAVQTLQTKELVSLDKIEKAHQTEKMSLQQVVQTKEKELLILQQQYQSTAQQETFLAQELREKEEEYVRRERELKDRLSQQYQQHLQEEKKRWESRLTEESLRSANEITSKQNEMTLLQQQIATCNQEITLLNTLLKKQEKENQSLEQHYQQLLSEKEQYYQDEMKSLLSKIRSDSQDEMNALSMNKQEQILQLQRDLSISEQNHLSEIREKTNRIATLELKIAEQQRQYEDEISKLAYHQVQEIQHVKLEQEQVKEFELKQLQKLHEAMIDKLQYEQDGELQKRKVHLEKVKESHLQEIEKLLEDHRNDLARVKASMTEKHSKEIEDLKSQFNVELKNVRDITTMTKDDQIQELQETMKILAMKKEEEVNRLQNEIAALQLKGANEVKEKAERIQELEDRLELLQSGKEGLNKKYQEEVNRLEEKLARSEQGWKARYEEEVTRLEGRHDEFLNALKTQHRNEVERLKDERDQELARHALESKQFLEKKDSFYQKELENLRQLLNENAQMRMEKVDQLQEEIISNRQVIHQLQNDLQQKEINHVSERKKAEKELLLEIEQIKQNQVWELKQKQEAHNSELATLQTIIKSIRQKNDQDIQSLQQQADEQIHAISAECEAKIAAMTEAMKKDSDNYHHLLKKYHTERAESSLQLENLTELNANLSQREKLLLDQLEKDNDKHQQNIFQLESSLQEKERQLNDAVITYQREIEKLKKDSSANLKERELSYEEQQRSLISSYEEKLKEKEEYYSRDRIPWLIKQSEKEKQQLLAEKNREIDELKAEQQDNLHQWEEKYLKESETMKTSFSQEISILKERIRHLSSSSDKKVTEIEAHYQQLLEKKEEEINVKQEQLRQELMNYYERKINLLTESLTKTNQQEIQQVLFQKDQEISQIAQERDNLQSLYASENKLKEQFQKQMQLLQKEIDLLRLENHNQLDRLGNEKESEIKEMKKEYLLTTETIQQKEKQKFEMMERTYQQEKMSLQQVVQTKEKELLILQQQYQSTAQQETFLAQELREKEEEYVRRERELKDRLSQQYQQQLQEEKKRWESRLTEESLRSANEITSKQNEMTLLQQQIATCNQEITLLNTLLKKQERENQSLEQHYQQLLSEKEQLFHLQNKELLEQQRRELQDEHLTSIQKQISFISQMIQSQSNNKHIEDMQSKFMDLIQDLPEYWKQKHNINFPSAQRESQATTTLATGLPPPPSVTQPSFSSELESSQYRYASSTSTSTSRIPKTPLHLLAGASADYSSSEVHRGYFEEPSKGLHSRQLQQPPKKANHLPWSSPSLRASPSDQLISAILDGDVQGIRTVVRSKGDDLHSEFWKDLARSILPLHRAISGLHFHGNVDYLIATIEVLIQLGADVHATDHAGNGVLHKAIQICTSKSINTVIDCLLGKGANPSITNKDGDSPLLAECKRVRTASEHVIAALIASTANPNLKNPHNSLMTPLSLLLMRGAATTAFGSSLIQNLMNNLGNFHHQEDDLFSENTPAKQSDSPSDGNNSKVGASPDVERSRASGRRVWIRALETLMKHGGRWDPTWKSPHNGVSQLHLFVASFPPSREDMLIYRSLLKNALDHGCNPNVEDDRGRNSLFILCEQLAVTPSDYCPDASRLVHYLLDAMISTPNSLLSNPNDRGVGGSDRSGRTIFDIKDAVHNSCLQACRTILLQATARISSSTSSAKANHEGISNSFITKAQQSKLLSGAVNGSSVSVPSSASYYEKEVPVPRISSSFIATHTNTTATSNGSSKSATVNPVKLFDGESRFLLTGDYSASIKEGTSLNKGGTISSFASNSHHHHHNNNSSSSSMLRANTATSAANNTGGRRNYFDEEDEEETKTSGIFNSNQRYYARK